MGSKKGGHDQDAGAKSEAISLPANLPIGINNVVITSKAHQITKRLIKL